VFYGNTELTEVAAILLLASMPAGLVTGLIAHYTTEALFIKDEEVCIRKPDLKMSRSNIPKVAAMAAISMILSTLVFLKFNLTLEALKYITLLLIFMVISVTDIKYRIIPNIVIVFGLVTGTLFLFLLPFPWSYVTGAAACAVFMLLIYIISRGGTGEGDVKLALVAGMYLGWPLGAVFLFLAYLAGGIAALLLIISKKLDRKSAMPFGPFLAFGGIAAALYGHDLMAWYLSRVMGVF
jgi:leader peptidase (prepilin peptidase)/N-methyltransferase